MQTVTFFFLVLGLGFRAFSSNRGFRSYADCDFDPKAYEFEVSRHPTYNQFLRWVSNWVSKGFRMGSSPIDASVGALVWVRRRNGSWWPGRIMGLDELPESCLVSPRSGTPVKLLGREDASVDWYNLEKSKRVKAFRCGEYDVCIEKAKASAAYSSKKMIKYARREDAILHALELEKARIKSAIKSPPMSGSSEKEKHEINRLEDSSESAREISRSGLSFEAPNFISSFKLQSEQGRRRRTPNDSEDDGTEGVKRMKGLGDLGMAVMSKAEDKEGNLVEPCQLEHVCKLYSSSFKRKRSQVPKVHEFLKKRNRRRPLTKLLESTAMVSAPVVYDEIGSPPPGPSDGAEFSESKMSLSTVNNDQSDSIRVEPEDGESLNAFEASTSNLNHFSSTLGLTENNSSDGLLDLQFAEEGKPPAGKQSSQSSQVETVCLRNEAPINESGSTSSAAAHAHGTSEWQSKGKRNYRNVNKGRKKADQNAHSNCIGGFEDSQCESRKQPCPSYVSLMPQRLLPYRQSRCPARSRFQMSDSSVSNLSPDGSLYSVKVEMEAGHRPQHVPLVSLTSKSNGKAIVGHPLTIEILSDGLCDRWSNGAKFNLEGDESGREARSSSRSRRMTGKRLKLLPWISGRKLSKTKKAAKLSKKIRKLSSLAGQEQLKNAMSPVVEEPEGPVIACIPLKVVFSRINEALTGLMRSAHRPVMSTNQ